jgi:predicted transcriptional regulator
MADDLDRQSTTIQSVLFDPADIPMLQFLRKRGPTYHINIAKALPYDIQYVSRRCKYLCDRGLLERQSRTYYALTERGEQILKDVSENESDT